MLYVLLVAFAGVSSSACGLWVHVRLSAAGQFGPLRFVGARGKARGGGTVQLALGRKNGPRGSTRETLVQRYWEFWSSSEHTS